MQNNAMRQIENRLTTIEVELEALRKRTFGRVAYYLLIVAAAVIILEAGYDLIRGVIEGLS